MSWQATPGSRSRFGPLAVLTFVVLLILGGLGTSPANAHASLRTSNPVDGAVVVNLPPRYELVFNEDIDPNYVQIVIADSAGGVNAQSGMVVRGPSVSGPLPRDLPAGQTAVRYRVVSADSHPIAGEITFELRPPSGQPTQPTQGAAATPDQARSAPPAAQAPAERSSEGVGNVTMLALGGIGALIFLAIAGLLLRADRRKH